MLKNGILSAAVVLLLVSSASAMTLTFSVTVNTTVSPQTFDVYAYCPGSAGLALINLDIAATGNVSFLSGSVKAAQGSTLDDEGTLYLTGFKLYRNGGTRTSQLISDVTAAQDTTYAQANDPFKDSLVIQNLGNSAPYQVYHGSFSGTNGTIYLSYFDGSVLMKKAGGPWVGPGNLLGTTTQGLDSSGNPLFPLTVVAVQGVVTPEPATLSLLALGGLAITRRRRR